MADYEWHETKENRLHLMLNFLIDGHQGYVRPDLHSEKWYALEPGIRAMRDRESTWTKHQDVIGLGIGPKGGGTDADEDLVLNVFVEKKKRRSNRKAPPIPQIVEFPEKITTGAGVTYEVPSDFRDVPGKFGSLEIEVVETPMPKLQNNGHAREPAMAGCGVSRALSATGTFGCLVRKKTDSDGSLYILSNNHVLANCNHAKVGDNIIQPGFMEGGKNPKDAIADLDKWIPYKYRGEYPNRADAAIAKVRQASLVDKRIRKLLVNPTGIEKMLSPLMPVKKVGSGSYLTDGTITQTDVAVRVEMDHPSGRRYKLGFRNQVRCTNFTVAGDSGSAVLDSQDRLVGLHFAGDADSSYFNRIEFIFEEWDLELA